MMYLKKCLGDRGSGHGWPQWCVFDARNLSPPLEEARPSKDAIRVVKFSLHLVGDNILMYPSRKSAVVPCRTEWCSTHTNLHIECDRYHLCLYPTEGTIDKRPTHTAKLTDLLCSEYLRVRFSKCYLAATRTRISRSGIKGISILGDLRACSNLVMRPLLSGSQKSRIASGGG